MKNTAKQYQQWLAVLKKSIDQSRLQTSLQANKNLIILYWYIGKQIEQKIDIENWGAKIISSLSGDLNKAFPELEGFSERNLLYMKQFAVAYPYFLITQQAAAQIQQKGKNQITQQLAAQFGNTLWHITNEELVSIPWGHHIYLMDKIEDHDQRIWYVKKTIENNWSRSVLKYQVDTDLYQRQEKAKKVNNFHLTLPKAQSDLANQILKDPYKFGFIQLGEQITEFELEQQIIKHIEEFLIELGAGFAFVGRQIKMRVGGKFRKLDLLFYHLYLQNINHPIGVSEYQYIKSLPKSLKDNLPSAKQLQQEVQKIIRGRRTKKQ
ncbi:MAG: DUF1016 family protein [Chitinophagaceae bacterium]|nr:DUF1016 family protein [Chitinophagaceae bacterium]